MAQQTLPSATPTDLKLAKREEFRQRLKVSRTAWLYILPSGILMLIISFWPQIYQVPTFCRTGGGCPRISTV